MHLYKELKSRNHSLPNDLEPTLHYPHNDRAKYRLTPNKNPAKTQHSSTCHCWQSIHTTMRQQTITYTNQTSRESLSLREESATSRRYPDQQLIPAGWGGGFRAGRGEREGCGWVGGLWVRGWPGGPCRVT